MGNENSDRTKTAKRMIPGAKEPVANVSTTEVDEATLKALISGETDPGSEIVAYFVEKCHTLAKAGIEIEAQYREVMDAKERIEQRTTRIRCEIDAAKQDLAEWYKRHCEASSRLLG